MPARMIFYLRCALEFYFQLFLSTPWYCVPRMHILHPDNRRFVACADLHIKIWVSKHPNLDYTDCFVLCTPTILPAIRISWDENPTFMLISGRAPRSFIHPCASTGGLRAFDTVIILKNKLVYENGNVRYP